MIRQRLRNGEYSVEFFPPKGPKGAARLATARKRLADLNPDFFSVTFGAGGSTQSGTLETVKACMHETGVPTAPHLSCVDGTVPSIRRMLDDYHAAGVKRIVALRGDLPDGAQKTCAFRYASDLVEFIRDRHGRDFHIEVAAYPEYHPAAPSPAADVANFAHKVRAGADAAMTQYFFNADAYFNFVDEARAHGVDVPIVPGVMPIHNFAQVARFSAGCGADIPRWIRSKMESYNDDTESIQAFGRDVVGRLCERLLDGGAPGLHFYALNQAEPTCALWQDLGLSRRSAAAPAKARPASCRSAAS